MIQSIKKSQAERGGPSSGSVRSRRPARERASRLLEYGALALVLAAATVFTGFNMFRFPHFENDEGTYMGSAWAMFEQGRLSYYTYTYDHPPLGWAQIGAWRSLTQWLIDPGMAVDTGRVLMLLVAMVSSVLVFAIVRRASGSTAAGLFAGVIFAVSPLGVSLHRQVWIDNIATMWLLASIYLLVAARGSLWRVVLSAVAFGLAFWTKEVFVAFLPGMLLLAHFRAHPTHRRFAFVLWATASLTAVSLFVLLAVVKDELLPPGVLWSSPEPHVSMLETYLYQASRGGGDGLLDPGGEFWKFFGQWRYNDPILMLGGIAASAVGLLLWRKDRVLFAVSVLTFTFLLFLGRGGVVLYYYVIPLLALFSLALGLLAGRLSGLASRLGRTPALVAAGALLVLTLALAQSGARGNAVAFESDSTSSQRDAARWISTNLPTDSTVIMDAYPWADLRDPSFTGGPVFRNAHYYFPALSDPEIRGGVLKDDWQNIDYVAVSPTTEADIRRGFVPLLPEAVENADEVRSFNSGDWRVRVLRIQKLHQTRANADPVLADSWRSYGERFVQDGRVTDPEAGGATASQAQSWALLRAVYMDDRREFDEIWGWTRENLQDRETALLAGEYGARSDGSQGVTREASDAGADTDAALALLFAAKRWDDPSYEKEARRMLNGIWGETAEAGDGRVMTAGSAEGRGANGEVQVDPASLSPHAYRIFAEADPEHPWEDLVGSSYGVFEQLRTAQGLGVQDGVAPDRLALDPATGEVLEASGERPVEPGGAQWRVSLDYLWFQDDRALETLEGLDLPRRELEREGRVLASYNADGSPASRREAGPAGYAEILPGMVASGDEKQAHEIFSREVLGSYTNGGPSSHYWGDDPDDLRDQNMAWFGTAIMDGAMGNLWEGEETIDWGEVEGEARP